MPLMTSFYTGVSGLVSSQQAINTTAHNLSNVYTDGYVRQQAQFRDGVYSDYGFAKVNPMQVGYGTYSARTQHYRDILWDRAYREQSGREGYYTAQYDAMEEVQTILGELNEEAFQDSLTDLWSSAHEMYKAPDSDVARASLVMHAETFITRAKEAYSDLVNYQERLNEKIETSVDRINEIGDRIYELNIKIQSVEAPNVEQAMDYRDERDKLVDELGGLISIVYEEEENGFLRIRAEGEEFVTKGGSFHMGVSQLNGKDGSVYETPIWPQNGSKPVFNLAVEISTARDNDIGSLKGLVQSRGAYTATYEDIPHVADPPKEADYTDENGVVDTEALQQAAEQYWNVDYPAYLKEVQTYEYNVGNSPIMKSQAMFDQLINRIVTMFNDIISPTASKTIPAGTSITIPAGAIYNQIDEGMRQAMEAAGITKENSFDDKGVAAQEITFTLTEDTEVTVLDMDKTGYGMDENTTPGTELFSRSDTIGRYTTFKDGDGNTLYLYNKNNEFGTEGKYSIENLEINQTILDNYSYLPFTTENGKIDMDRGQQLLDAWDTATINLNPDNMTPKDINDYYSSMVSIIANDGYVYRAISENQNSAVANLDEARINFTGVSSNDELTNLITFQNAYNANSRYINVISDMLDTLIQRVGHW